MKKHIGEFINGFLKISATFVITFITATVSTDNQNYIYTFLSKNGFSDVVMQKVVLSGVIVTIVGFFQILCKLIFNLILWGLRKYFKRLTVNINFKVDNHEKEIIEFKPIDGEYSGEQVDIEIEVVPAGKVSMLILKVLGLQLEIFFNPQIIDVFLLNDKEWLNEKATTHVNNENGISIKLLANYRLGGTFEKKFVTTENIVILPKRVRRGTSYLDFKLKSNFGVKISNALCESQINELNIECIGGN